MPDEPREHRPMQAGDVIGTGTDQRIVVMIYSAGECLEALAELAALAQRKEKTTVDTKE